MKNVFNSLVLFFSMIGVASAQYQNPSPCSQLIWEDNFDGTSLDAAKWSAQIGDGCDIGNCGWGNNEEQYYTDRSENIVVEDGVLKIIALKEDYSGKSYTSARIRSMNKGDFTFGRIEARMKLPQGAGSWPAFWMLPTDDVYGSWPQSGEIDIMEFQGKTPTFVSGTAHYGGPYPDHKYKGLIQTLPGGQFYYDDFHVFAIEWDSTSIRWYRDDINYHTLTSTAIFPDAWPFIQRFHVVLNNAIGGDLGGLVDDASFPQVVEIDYVRVYSIPFNRKMKGKTMLFENAQNVKYTLPGDVLNEDSYVWSVPSGASIVAGQGTKELTVDWGPYVSSTPVNINLEVTSSCDVFNIDYPVTINEDACTVVLDDAESTHRVSYKYSTGTSYSASFLNNTPNAVNSSSSVIRYRRRNTEPFDRIIYNNVLLSKPTEYESGNRLFFLDIFSTVPVGTEILLQFQNSDQAEDAAYPAGIRSTFSAVTTKSGEWERLRFVFSTLDNASINTDNIDELVLALDYGNLTSNIYYLDNLKQTKVQEGCILDGVTSAREIGHLVTYPNPVHDYVTIQYPETLQKASLFVIDVMGNVVLSYENLQENRPTFDLNLTKLPTGTYYIRMVSDDKTLVSQLVKM